MHQVFEKQCGYQANSSLHFIILICLSHIDLVAPVVAFKTLLKEGETIHVCT